MPRQEKIIQPTLNDEVAAASSKGKQKQANGAAFDRSVVDNVPVRLTAMLGRSQMKISELMALEEGAIVELDSSLNHLADLCLNDQVIARGEIVAVKDNFGLKITEIII